MSKIDVKMLIEQAIGAAQNAYAPYSDYPVGAALLATDGIVFTGCNVENAAFPVTICAERVALVKAVSVGYRDFTAIAVATRDGGTPCGMCRQMLFEFSPNMRVIIVDADGKIHHDDTLRKLLPYGFETEVG